MPPILKSLGIDRMSREQRIELVQEIWDAIAAESIPPTLTEDERIELQRRVDEDNSDPHDVVPWEQVKAEALGRLKP
jgi:putative addiction module component (TIGR02574 family)